MRWAKVARSAAAKDGLTLLERRVGEGGVEEVSAHPPHFQRPANQVANKRG